MNKRILIPTDFSKNALNAIRYTIDLYAKLNCDFYFLNVYDFEKYLYSNDAAAKLLGEESTDDVIDKGIYTYVDPAHFGNMENSSWPSCFPRDCLHLPLSVWQ